MPELDPMSDGFWLREQDKRVEELESELSQSLAREQRLLGIFERIRDEFDGEPSYILIEQLVRDALSPVPDGERQ